MFGRGRGKILLDDSLAVPPRRPGSSNSDQTPVPPPSRLGLLDPLFQGRTVDDIIVFKAIHSFISPPCSALDIEQMAEYILTKLLIDPSNAASIAKYIYIASKNSMASGDLVLRKFFSQLEAMYSDREKFDITKGSVKYRNFTLVFSSVTHYTRNVNYPPFDDLINGLYDLMEPLVKSENEEDLRVLAISTVRYSLYMKMVWPSKSPPNLNGDFEVLLNAIRTKITSRGLIVTEIGLGWLLLAVEASTIGFDKLTLLVRNHYKLSLGSAVDALSSKSDIIQLPKNEVLKYKLDDLPTTSLAYV